MYQKDPLGLTLSNGLFILNGTKVEPCHLLYEWALWMEGPEGRQACRIAMCEINAPIGKLTVSTVFTGIDIASSPVVKPEVFETMVFVNDSSKLVDRYRSYADAELGHVKWVREVMETMTWQTG